MPIVRLAHSLACGSATSVLTTIRVRHWDDVADNFAHGSSRLFKIKNGPTYASPLILSVRTLPSGHASVTHHLHGSEGRIGGKNRSSSWIVSFGFDRPSVR